MRSIIMTLALALPACGGALPSPDAPSPATADAPADAPAPACGAENRVCCSDEDAGLTCSPGLTCAEVGSLLRCVRL